MPSQITEKLHRRLQLLDIEMGCLYVEIKSRYPYKPVPIEVILKELGPIAKLRTDTGLRKLEAAEKKTL